MSNPNDDRSRELSSGDLPLDDRPRSSPEVLTARAWCAARWTVALLAGSLIVHIIITPVGDPTTLVNVHLGLTIGAGMISIMIWCTHQLQRSIRRARKDLADDLKKMEKRVVTADRVRQLVREVFDEGQISGLSASVAAFQRPKGR